MRAICSFAMALALLAGCSAGEPAKTPVSTTNSDSPFSSAAARREHEKLLQARLRQQERPRQEARREPQASVRPETRPAPAPEIKTAAAEIATAETATPNIKPATPKLNPAGRKPIARKPTAQRTKSAAAVDRAPIGTPVSAAREALLRRKIAQYEESLGAAEIQLHAVRSVAPSHADKVLHAMREVRASMTRIKGQLDRREDAETVDREVAHMVELMSRMKAVCQQEWQ